MTIQIGDKLPNADFLILTAEGPGSVALSDMIDGKKVILFGLPGAYTGTCTNEHMPSFVENAAAIQAKGVDAIICVSVNDPFVMAAWAKDTGADAAGLHLLGDAESTFITAIGMDFTAPPAGLIKRAKRFAMIVEDGTVTALEIEENPGQCSISRGDSLLEKL